MKSKTITRLLVAAAAFALVLALPLAAQAKTVSPSGDTSGRKDLAAINAALAKSGNVKLKSGKTYYIKGNIYVSSNQSITATGATVISQSGAVRNMPYAKSIDNFRMTGGTWTNSQVRSYNKTMVQFAFGSNITMDGVTVECGMGGHALELIACKNVTVSNCTLQGVGTPGSTSVEEQLQIDLATPVTAPTVHRADTSLCKGQTCSNITVTGCTISGARGLCANYAARESKYRTKFHKNIKIVGNTITGYTSEAVALFNVMGATVKNNVIVTKSPRTGTAYSVGLHVSMFGKAPKAMAKSTLNIQGNTIKGGREGLLVSTHSASSFGKVTVKKNKCYARQGKGRAISIKSAKKLTAKSNKTYKWK